MELPFYYIVRFKLIEYNNPNELKIHRHEIRFSESEPIVNRNNAFNEFEEYLGFIKDQLIEKNGVLYINSIFPFGEYAVNKVYEKFEQSIEVVLKVVKSIEGLYSCSEDGSYENEFVIHKISSDLSYNNNPQWIMDGLIDEMSLYDHFKLNKGDKEKTVRFYGLDYYDTGEDPDVLDNRILSTPFNWADASYVVEPEPKTLSDFRLEILKKGEGFNVEFKPSLLYNFLSKKAGYAPMYHAAKSIASFLNSDGGILIIGVGDNGEIQGLKHDYSLFSEKQKDKFKLTFDSLFYQFLKPSLRPFLDTRFIEVNQEEIFIVDVIKCNKPVFLRTKNGEKEEKEFFIRTEASSVKLNEIEDIIEYIFSNWNKDK
jgi:hypothetical protein